MKIDHIGCKPDRGQSMRWGGAALGQLAHRVDRAAYPGACLGPTLLSVVLDSLLPEFCNFHDRISFCCCGVLPPHFFLVYLYAQHVETNTYTKEIESE